MAERQTNAVSPRVDDQLKHEGAALTHGAGVTSRREDLRVEPPDDIETTHDASHRDDVVDHESTGLPVGMADTRAELARHLIPSVFPATPDDLLAAAEASFAADELVRWLRTLPPRQRFDNVQAVWVALGGDAETRHP